METVENTPKPVVTLQALLSDRRVELTSALSTAKSTVEFRERLDAALTEIQDVFQSGLPLFSARYVNRSFSLLRSSLPLVEAIDHHTYSVAKQRPPTGSPDFALAPLFPKIAVLGILLFALSLSSQTRTGILLVTAALVLVCLELIGLSIAALQSHRQSYSLALRLFGLSPVRRLEEKPEYIVTPELHADADKVVHTLMTAFGDIDRGVAERRERDNSIPGKSLGDFPEVIEFLQKMASAAALKDMERALTVAQSASSVLLTCDIKAQAFSDEQKAEWFEFEPAVVPAITTRITDLVALVGPKGVIRPGRVIEPYVPPSPRS